MTETATPDDAPFSDEPKQRIIVDANGDPERQGTLMIERQSYERLIEGLKIAADAAMHMACRAATEAEANSRVRLALHLDKCRLICVEHAGVEDRIGQRQTEVVRGREPMRWREARERLLFGLNQASGGARQLATCFRIDLTWSRTAFMLETLESKVRNPKRMTQHNPLLLPTGYVRH